MYMSIENELSTLDSLTIDEACSSLSVSRSGYYKWLKRKESSNASDPLEMKLKNEIHDIAIEFSGYGYRRVTKELQRRGYIVNGKRILKIMRQDNLLCLKRNFHPPSTNSNHNFKVYPNLAKNMNIMGINQLWVSDITYIQLLKEFIYLAVVLDVFSKKCIGWELDRSMDTQLTLNALYMALNNRWDKNNEELVHHSDQGIQYAAQAYIDCLKKHNIKISMSRKRNPYDNCYAESFIKTLKYEEVYISEYDTFNDAYKNIKRFIEEVYNKKRLHSAIGYLPPDEFEDELNLNSSP